jgi:hypothetical protein
MKKYIKFALVLLLVLVSAVIFAQVVTPTHSINANDIPIGGTVTQWIYWGLGIALFLYEVVCRFIPSSTNNSILHKIGVLLNFLVSLVNGGIGNAAKLPDGSTGTFKSTPTPVK